MEAGLNVGGEENKSRLVSEVDSAGIPVNVCLLVCFPRRGLAGLGGAGTLSSLTVGQSKAW